MSHHRTLRRLAGAAGAIAALLALASGLERPSVAQTGPTIEALPVEAGESGPLVPPGPEPDLVLLYTGGVVGYVEPCG